MTGDDLVHAVVDLTWSLWTELGVPGVSRHHAHTVVDPEPLIVFSPAIFEFDPRLRDEVFGWCAVHASHVSVSRMRGILKTMSASEQAKYASFTATLRAHSKVQWPTDNSATPWDSWQCPTGRWAPRLPMHRPALARLRFRAFSGVGARADVLCELLARQAKWTRASELTHLGYSKRVVALILSDLFDAGIVKGHSEKNARVYQLEDPPLWTAASNAQGLVFPEWAPIVQLALLALEFRRHSTKPETVRRVQASKMRPDFDRLGQELGLHTPPVTRGNEESWQHLMDWLVQQMRDVADGTSAALNSPQQVG
jgi:hypothetical protein